MSSSPPTSQTARPTLRLAVIGGGLTGLAAAHRLMELAAAQNRPLDLTLYETGGRTGGVIGTRRIGDYLVELGADSFITNKPAAVQLARRLGLEDRLIPTDDRFRRSLVLFRGKPVPVPEGFMLLSPARIWPVLSSPLFTPWGKLRMGLEYFIPRRKAADDESLASFVRRRFGNEALQRLVQPLVGGIYTADPEHLSLQATMPRFLEMEQQHRSLIAASRKQSKQQSEAARSGSGARYGLFATFAGGLGELLQTLRDRVSASATLKEQTRLIALQPLPDSRQWQLRFADGTSSIVDGVLLAIRAGQAAQLLRPISAELGGALERIPYASSAIVVSGHRLQDIDHPLDAFGLVVPAVERRNILAVSFASRKFPGRAPEGRVLLRTFVGGAMQPELLDRSDEELQALVRDELASLLGVRGEPDFSLVARYTGAMPQYHVGHVELVDRIETLVRQWPNLRLAGNAYHGVGIPDCIANAEQAAQELLNNPTA